MKKKKILIDLLKIKNMTTGLGQVSSAFAETISNKYSQEFEWNFFLPSTEKKIYNSEINIVHPKIFERYFPSVNNTDVWHSLHQDSAYMPNNKAKYILTIHDLNFLYEKTKIKKNIRYKRLEKKIKRANAIVSISDFTKNEIENNFDLTNKKILTIYNGVKNITEIKPQKPLMIQEKERFLFCVCNITERKNIVVLCDMMKKIQGYKLIISGNKNTTYGEQLEKKILTEKIENVLLTGIISENEKTWLYKNCEAFVFPSVLEGFGLPVIEAMQFGKPVFLSEFTSLPEIGNDAAFYFKNFDSLYMKNFIQENILLYNSDRKYKEKTLQRVEFFTWKKCINEYLKLYGEI